MNIKSLKLLLLIILLIINLSSCRKRNNLNFANYYYNMALLELKTPSTNQNKIVSYKKALYYIEKAIEEKNKESKFLALKATLLFELGEYEIGNNYFNEALKYSKDSRLKNEILNNKACLFAEVGLFEKNDKKINQALEIWSSLIKDKNYLTPEVAYFNMAKIFIKRNDINLAKKYLFKAISLAPNYIDAYFNLALIFYFESNFKNAYKYAKKILYLYPEHKSAKNLINAIKINNFYKNETNS